MEVSTSIHHFLFLIKNFAHDSILFTLHHPTLPRFNLLHILLMTVSYLHLSPKDNLYVRPFNGVWSTYWWQHWENWPLPQQLGISHRTLASGGTLWPTAQGIQLFSLFTVAVLGMASNTLTLYVQLFCVSRRHWFIVFTLFPSLPPKWYLSLWKKGWGIYVQFSTRNYTVNYSLHVGHWGSVLTMIYCNQKFCWWGMKCLNLWAYVSVISSWFNTMST